MVCIVVRPAALMRMRGLPHTAAGLRHTAQPRPHASPRPCPQVPYRQQLTDKHARVARVLGEITSEVRWELTA
jgi:hypothetical protein